MIRSLLALTFCIGTALAAEVPRKSPELAYTLLDGRQALLSQYRGKVIALEFLLTTCPHCQRASSVLERLYKEYGPRGVQVLGVAINPPPAGTTPGQQVTNYVKMLGLTFPVGFTTHEMAADYLQNPIMLRMMMPQLVLIDRKGMIQAQYAGDNPFFEEAKEEANMREAIEKILKEGTAAKKPAAKTKSAVTPAARKKPS